MLNPLISKPPTNLKQMREQAAGSRKTAPPTESVYERYVHTVGSAPNEATMDVEMSEHILKKYNDKGYQRAFNKAFTGFPKDVGFNNDLSAPQPDFVEGLQKQDYRQFPVDDHVKSYSSMEPRYIRACNNAVKNITDHGLGLEERQLARLLKPIPLPATVEASTSP
jgi:hypothetical protein